MQRNETQRGEYYTSGVIKAMLTDGHEFRAIEVDAVKDFHVLGTPPQVEEFCATWPRQLARRWCFDLDNTLVTHPTVAGDYSTCKPIPHMIQQLKDLYDAGHYIIIHTARRMRTHSGNVPAVIADIGQVRRTGYQPSRGGLQGTRPELRSWQLGGPASELAYEVSCWAVALYLRPPLSYPRS
eukprot:2462238-Pyramimonas_sp.AAC.1